MAVYSYETNILNHSKELSEWRTVITDLLAEGSETYGIFRKSGNALVLNNRPYVCFGVHEKATRLKQMMLRTPRRMICRSTTEILMEVISNNNGDKTAAVYQALFNDLSAGRLEKLALTVFLLRRVAENEEKTMMNPRNLSICLSPSIFDLTPSQAMDSNVFYILDFMIRNPVETIPHYECFTQNLLRNCLVDATFQKKEILETTNEFIGKSEEEERMKVDEKVLTQYANCVEELKKVTGKEEKKELEKEEGELIVWWEREDDESTLRESPTTDPTPSSFSSYSSDQDTVVESEKNSPPSVENVEDVEKETETKEETKEPAKEMSNLEMILEFCNQQTDVGRMSTATFRLDVNEFGEGQLTRRETAVWCKADLGSKRLFFETMSRLTK